jgi:hypothetical protein
MPVMARTAADIVSTQLYVLTHPRSSKEKERLCALLRCSWRVLLHTPPNITTTARLIAAPSLTNLDDGLDTYRYDILLRLLVPMILDPNVDALCVCDSQPTSHSYPHC